MENNKQEAYGPWRSAWEQTWPLAKVSEVAHTLSFYPRGQYWAYFYSTGSGLWDTGRFLQNCHIWAWNLATAQSSRIEVVHTICFYPRGVKIEPIFPLRAEVFEIWADFQNCHIQAWNLWPKLRKLHIYYISAPGGWIWAYFCSEGSGFRDTGRFSKLPYLGMKLGNLGNEIWKLAKIPEVYITQPTPESQILLSFALQLAISKILAFVLHFPFGYNQSFFKKFKF